MRALQEWSKCVMLLIRLICGTHSTFPYSPVSLPSGRGEAGSYPHPALKQGKAKHRSCLVSIGRFALVPSYGQIYLAGLMDYLRVCLGVESEVSQTRMVDWPSVLRYP
jgi:hypothetical protein